MLLPVLLGLLAAWFLLGLPVVLFVARCMRVGHGPNLADDAAANNSGVDSSSYVA